MMRPSAVCADHFADHFAKTKLCWTDYFILVLSDFAKCDTSTSPVNAQPDKWPARVPGHVPRPSICCHDLAKTLNQNGSRGT